MAAKPKAQDFVVFPSHITLEDAMKLSVGDKIDHRDNLGYFAIATVLEKQGSKLKIHYDGYPIKYDQWCDFEFVFALERFAPKGSISHRPSYQDHFRSLQVCDHVDINPRLPGMFSVWEVGTIVRFSKTRGQVNVEYTYQRKKRTIWTHLDNEKEIAQYTTKQSRSYSTEWDPIDIVKALLWDSDGKSVLWIASEMGRTINDVKTKIREQKKKKKKKKRQRSKPKRRKKHAKSRKHKRKRKRKLEQNPYDVFSHMIKKKRKRSERKRQNEENAMSIFDRGIFDRI